MASFSRFKVLGEELTRLLEDVRSCRLCRENPIGPSLPHEPRPVVRASATARLAIYGQAPGTRVHATGVPFLDPSGDRLRAWMGVDHATFYDANRIALVPMGFCFPGHDAKGGDLPPRRECAPAWRDRLIAAMPQVELALLVGSYAQRWHLGAEAAGNLTETVAAWRRYLRRPGPVRYIPVPHPSWRNNAWLKRHPWFEAELLPELRAEVARSVTSVAVD